MKKLLAVLGPTATGKTDLALYLAKKYNGELVSCDSRQVYRGLDIGTGKEASAESNITKGNGWWEVDGVKIWMYDVADPKVQYTVKDYVEQAEKVIEDISSRKKLPIIVGGTGLYLKGLLEGFSNLSVLVDPNLRGELQKLTLEQLQNKLQALSPSKWESLNNSDRKNPRRLLRSIELSTMNPYSRTSDEKKVISDRHEVLKIGLNAPRLVLKERIYRRLISRIQQGMIEEADKLNREGISLTRMKELGLEYGVLAKVLSKELSKEDLVKELSTKINQYAKRQVTWFKKEKDINWFDITDKDWLKKVEKLVFSWYHARDDQKN